MRACSELRSWKSFVFLLLYNIHMIITKMDADKHGLKLRQLVEEYMVSVELRRHDRVSQLSSIIRSSLIELLDDDLSGGSPGTSGYIPDDVKHYQFIIDAIETICNRLRDQGHIATIYDNVIEFVQLRDLVCLSRLLGVGPEEEDVGGGSHDIRDEEFDFDLMAKILRQSIQVLRFINLPSDALNNPTKEIWFDRNCLERKASIGFSRYFLDTEKGFSIRERKTNLETMMRLLNDIEPEMNARVISLIKTDWFVDFLRRALMPPYPVDGFTVLVSIWIIGVKCRHRVLEQLVGELVDQVYHEETNSCSSEDLMLLTQVGAIWLSHHKRHQTTMKQASRQAADDDDEELDEDASGDFDVDDHEDDSSSSSSSLSPVSENRASRKQAKHPQAMAGSGGHQLTDLRLKLRHLIDDELLHGGQCQICAHQPTDLMGPIKMNSACAACGLNSTGVDQVHCAISHRRLEILDLGQVLQLFRSSTSNHGPIKMIALISPSEWVREILTGYGGVMTSSEHDNADGSDIDEHIGEQVDISEKFERLTMIRGENRKSARAESSESLSDNSGDTGDDEDSRADSLDESQRQSAGDDNYSQVGAMNDYNQIIRNFMKVRRNFLAPLQACASPASPPAPSESLMMIKFLKTNSGAQQQQRQQAQFLPICLTDLLLLDTCGAPSEQKIRLSLVESGRNLLAEGSLWQCSGRSKISGLHLGCERTFGSLELIRLSGQGSGLSPEEFGCPLCGQHLYRIRLLAEALGA